MVRAEQFPGRSAEQLRDRCARAGGPAQKNLQENAQVFREPPIMTSAGSLAFRGPGTGARPFQPGGVVRFAQPPVARERVGPKKSPRNGSLLPIRGRWRVCHGSQEQREGSKRSAVKARETATHLSGRLPRAASRGGNFRICAVRPDMLIALNVSGIPLPGGTKESRHGAAVLPKRPHGRDRPEKNRGLWVRAESFRLREP